MTTQTTTPIPDSLLPRLNAIIAGETRLRDHRRSLVAESAADPNVTGERLVTIATDLAVAEARVALAVALRWQAGASVDVDEYREALFRCAVESPNDTWSGRGNDLRRAVADARRDIVERVYRFTTGI